MKVKQRNLCKTCRRRKLACDGQRPACGQCVHSRLECCGYPEEWTFVQQNGSNRVQSSAGSGDQQALRCTTSQKQVSGPEQPTQTLPAELVMFQRHLGRSEPIDLLDIVVDRFVPGSERAMPPFESDSVVPRICGSWVQVLSYLPCLHTRSTVLSKTVTALAASILSRPHMSNLDWSSRYHAAVYMLRKRIGGSDGTSDFEFIPTAMCLTLMELMIPGAAAAFAAHTKAVGRLFQTYSPDTFKHGYSHRLFVGFRPLLLLQAIQDREPTFLAFRSWIDDPFSNISPSLMQCLLSDVVMLPSLLHETDSLLEASHTSYSEVGRMLDVFLHLFNLLGSWEGSLNAEHQLYWGPGSLPKNTPGVAMEDTHLSIRYASVTMANLFTYIWAFQIVCLTEMKRLTAVIHRRDPRQPVLAMPLEPDLHQDRKRTTSLAKKIYLSMDYLLQDDMGLFGPTSTFYPLKVAYQALEEDDSDHNGEMAYIQQVIGRLTQKGLLCAPSFISPTRAPV